MSSVSSINSILDGTGSSTSSANSASGVNISSILAATSGNTAALDVTSAVSSAVYALRAPERVWESDQTTLTTQATDLDAIQAATATVSTDLASFNSVTGPLSSRTATTSSSQFTATAASGTTAGVHTVQITSLAATASAYSSAESSATTALSAGSVSITSSSGSTQSFSTGSGTTGDTLNDLATAINAASLGVSASVVNDANGSRLALIANTSGSAANFSVSSSSQSFAFTQPVQGADASLTVDGIPISSATNTVTGAISGVTLSLSGTTSTAATLTVASNTSSISTAISQFVTDYNSALSLVNAQFKDGTEGTEGVLAGDTIITNLQSTLEQASGYVATPPSGTTTTVSSLSDLGITVNEDGSLALNSTTLNSALSNNPTDVQNFFQGSSLNGFANTFNTSLNTFTDTTSGAFTLDLSGLTSQYNDLANQLSNFETNYITPKQAALQADYSSAEEALQQLPTTIKDLQAELGEKSS